jgi:hypothetical protein
MKELNEVLYQLDNALNQIAPDIAERLQPGLTRAEIDQRIAEFSLILPQDVYVLYQWHDGLSGQAGKMNLIEKLLRQKDKWHGELSGKANELHLNYQENLITAKFLPLEYALAGHRHLKFGKCVLDLLPVFIFNDGVTKRYCMVRLDSEPSIVYCANGVKVPPMGITEEFLSTQVQFVLADLISFLTESCQQAIQPSKSQDRLAEAPEYDLSSEEFAQIYQRYQN